MLKSSYGEFAGILRRMVSSHPSLSKPFQFPERLSNTFAMSFEDPRVSSDQGREADAFGSAEGSIPARPMLPGGRVGAGSLAVMSNQLFFTMRILPITKAVILVSGYGSGESPLLGQFTLPLAPNGLTFTVVVSLGTAEVLLVIKLPLSRGQRFREG